MTAARVLELARLRREAAYEERRLRRRLAMQYVATAPQRGHEAEPRAAT